MFRYDGKGWIKVVVGTKQAINGMGGNVGGVVHAVGALGTMLEYSGTSWKTTSHGPVWRLLHGHESRAENA